ncbi:MAG: hypothetical protein ACYCQJ_14265 [Nitrososphaerales archaeon]
MEQLKQKYLEAQWAYVKEMSSSHQQAFQERLNRLGKIKYRYDYLDGLNGLVSETKPSDKELKTIYHQCMLKYHPDKTLQDSSEMAQKIAKFYQEGNLQGLKKILEGRDYTLEELESQIKKITGTLYWQWGEGDAIMKGYIESLYLDTTEYERLKEENQRLSELLSYSIIPKSTVDHP